MTKPIPDGYHSVTPSLTLRDTQRALDFYQRAFNAEVLTVAPHPSGRGTMHAVMKIGNSLIMMGDEMGGDNSCKSAETVGHSPISLYVYVTNVDEAFDQAVKAGAKTTMPPADMFWGDRAGGLVDPFGYSWMIATHKADLNPQQIQQGAQEFFASFAKK